MGYEIHYDDDVTVSTQHRVEHGVNREVEWALWGEVTKVGVYSLITLVHISMGNIH
jgi:hypothetical protein